MADTETREMLPDVQAYFDALNAADKAKESGMDALYEKYPNASPYGTDEQRERSAKFEVERSLLRQAARAARLLAWRKLDESSDPLVAWISKNCEDVQSQAKAVLRILPATREELDDLAQANGWCGEWGEFVEQATAAGVLPAAPALLKDIQKVLDGINAVTCCRLGATDRRHVTGLLEAFAASVRAGEVSAV